MSQKGINMKNLLLISILLSLPVYATDFDEYGIPYCQSKQSFNCHVKNYTENNLSWYQVREQRWINNGNQLSVEVIKLGFEHPYQNYNKLCEDFKIQTIEEIENDWNIELQQRKIEQKEYEKSTKKEVQPTNVDYANLYKLKLQKGEYNMSNFHIWRQFIPDILFLSN